MRTSWDTGDTAGAEVMERGRSLRREGFSEEGREILQKERITETVQLTWLESPLRGVTVVLVFIVNPAMVEGVPSSFMCWD